MLDERIPKDIKNLRHSNKTKFVIPSAAEESIQIIPRSGSSFWSQVLLEPLNYNSCPPYQPNPPFVVPAEACPLTNGGQESSYLRAYKAPGLNRLNFSFLHIVVSTGFWHQRLCLDRFFLAQSSYVDFGNSRYSKRWNIVLSGSGLSYLERNQNEWYC